MVVIGFNNNNYYLSDNFYVLKYRMPQARTTVSVDQFYFIAFTMFFLFFFFIYTHKCLVFFYSVRLVRLGYNFVLIDCINPS